MAFRTCGECPHVESHPIPMAGLVWCCALTKMCVPQNVVTQGEQFESTFHRIPSHCPLPGDQAEKSEDAIDREHWTVKHTSCASGAS